MVRRCLPTLLLALVRETVRSGERGAAFGVLETVVALGNVLAHAGFGILSDRDGGDAAAPLAMLFFLSVGGVVLFARLLALTPPESRLSRPPSFGTLPPPRSPGSTGSLDAVRDVV